MSSRERLATAQAELMRALWDVGPVPRGFDEEGVRQEGRTLLAKRRRQAAKSRPALGRALGRGFGERFAAFCAETPFPGSPCADAARFARWLDERLGDEWVIERIDWSHGLRALLASEERALAPEERADLEQFEALLEGIARRRGPLAAEEPRLKAALVVASLRAFGVALTREAGRALQEALAAALPPPSAPSSLLDAALGLLRANRAVERVLAAKLDAEQRALYAARVGEDPFQGRELPRVVLEGDESSVARALENHWGAGSAVREVAERHARAARALPEPPSAGPERRRALLERTLALLELQERSESELGPLLSSPGMALILIAS